MSQHTATQPTGQVRPPKPSALRVIPDAIPPELKGLRQWVIWRYTWIEGKNGKPGKWDKPLLNSHTGNLASHSSKKTWSDFDAAIRAYTFDGSNLDGIGFVFHKDNGLIGVDLDHCRDPITGIIEAWAQQAIETFNTYTEISTSGTGIHLICKGTLPGQGIKTKHAEIYNHVRYFCTTGNVVEGTPGTIEASDQAIIDDIYQRLRATQAGAKTTATPSNDGTGPSPDLDDDTLLEKALSARNSQKFRALWAGEVNGYPSQSEADLALCRQLAFWTQDPAQINRLFRRSERMREKWDTHPTYAEWTINKALETTREHYQGRFARRHHQSQASDEEEPAYHSPEFSEVRDKPEPFPLDDVHKAFQKYFHLPDTGVIDVSLATYLANWLPGDPTWTQIIGPPSGGKTEPAMSMRLLDQVRIVSTMTEAALLSGTAAKDIAKGAKGGLLREMGKFGILICKDFTSILSMRAEQRSMLLAHLRDIYDGHMVREVGTDGGRSLLWEGKLGFLAVCTDAIDSHHGVMAAMGHRFLFYRLPESSKRDRQAQALIALKARGQEEAMRKELADLVKRFIGAIDIPEILPELSESDEQFLITLSDFTTQCRSAVERDGFRREIELIHGKELPPRLVKALAHLHEGFRMLGVSTPRTRQLLAKIALDSIPKVRLLLIEKLAETEDSTPTRDLGSAIGYPTETTRRALEDLMAQHVIERSGVKTNSHLWKITEDIRADYWAIKTFSEKSHDP
jgi:hypothetical protein